MSLCSVVFVCVSSGCTCAQSVGVCVLTCVCAHVFRVRVQFDLAVLGARVYLGLWEPLWLACWKVHMCLLLQVVVRLGELRGVCYVCFVCVRCGFVCDVCVWVFCAVVHVCQCVDIWDVRACLCA